MTITAVVLSARPYERALPAGLRLLERVGTIDSPAALQQARFAAIADVQTRCFFYLDDDDDLPNDIGEVLERCAAAGAAVAYTDELITDEAGGEVVRNSGRYAQRQHLLDPMLIHHLALCDTRAARESLKHLPRGDYCPEMLLYWQLAKLSAAHVPEIGYVWHRRPTGMHAWPSTTISQMRAALWCQAHP